MNNETKIKTDLLIKTNPEIISRKEVEDLLKNNNIKNNVIKE